MIHAEKSKEKVFRLSYSTPVPSSLPFNSPQSVSYAAHSAEPADRVRANTLPSKGMKAAAFTPSPYNGGSDDGNYDDTPMQGDDEEASGGWTTSKTSTGAPVKTYDPDVKNGGSSDSKYQCTQIKHEKACMCRGEM